MSNKNLFNRGISCRHDKAYLGLVIVSALVSISLLPRCSAAEAPKLIQKDGRYALMVDGHPYLILGGQIHNSSAWPVELPQVWESRAALHANTVEAQVYWEQLEDQEGRFDFTNVDQIVEGAGAHNLHPVFLWFGTWKNGNIHSVPAWVKSDTKRFPRVIRPDREPIDVLSPLSRNTLDADKTAFVTLIRHLKQIDHEQHTVLLIQVENESGNIGSVRDNSPEANLVFAGAVPSELLTVAHKRPGTCSQVFGPKRTKRFSSTIRRSTSTKSQPREGQNSPSLVTSMCGSIIRRWSFHSVRCYRINLITFGKGFKVSSPS